MAAMLLSQESGVMLLSKASEEQKKAGDPDLLILLVSFPAICPTFQEPPFNDL